MTFEEVFDHAIAMLQRKGRVSYRALKAQFQLDDDLLALLMDEIIEVHQLASDQDGKMLVWRGETPTTPGPALQALPHDGSPPPTTPRPREAERRQLTVMFCDLVGSTALSGQLDPEDLRDVVRAYQEAAAAVIHRYEGHIAQYLGDGLLIYSGYPQAHEDDAQRAIRIGLGIVDAIEHLNPRLEQQYGVRLAVRVGIHTGPVVVGEMGGSGRHEQLALGETPNIAARLEGLASANQVVISESTRRLVGGTFDLEDLGTHTMKGVAEPRQVYGVRGEQAVESRFEAATVTGLTPLVGREEEVGLVLRRWEQTKEGEGQVVLLCGEPGIGKSRLTQTIHERVAEEPHIRLRYQCSPYYVNSAFYPIITQLERAAQFTRDDTPAQKLDKLEALLGQGTAQVAEIASLFATLLAIPLGDRYPSLSLTPQRQKEKIIEALVDQIIGFARQQPVLFIWEDIHWCDPTSLEVLDFLMHHVTKTRTLVVITYRPEFEPPWREFAHVTTYTLNRLTRREVTTLVDGVTGGKALPDEVLDQIAVKTDGVPLFVEELTKTVLESGLLHEADNHYALSGPLPPLAIPSTLQDALMARLDRLASVKEVAQIGATLGREFTYELVAVVSSLQDATLQDALDQLVSAELLVQRGTPPAVSYLFKHALVQDTAYTSLLKSRRQQLHTRIAQVLEAQFPITAETEPEVLAHHYTAAGLGEQAIGYWHQAGQKASAQSAYVEAIAHLTRGLEVVTTLADTPNRAEHELQLQLVLGDALAATKSYAAPEVGHAYSRAWTLGQQLPESPQSFTALFSLWRFRHNEAELQAARQLAEELLHLAQSRQSSLYRMHAHLALGCTLFYRGDFVETQAHVEQSLTLAAQQPSDVWAEVAGTRVASLLYAAYVLWYRGYANQAVDRMRTAIRLAQDMQHPFTLGFAHTVSCQFSQSMRDPHKTYTEADALIAFSMEQEFPMWQARATVPRGWALAVQEGTEEGITQMHQGLDALERMGARVLRTHELAQLAEGYGQDEQIEAGLRTLAEALALAAQTEERFVEAELYRLKGELLLASSLANQMKAEASFQQALDVARNQQAKSLELRAATSLARLWQQQGKCQDAYDLLAPIYNWFTEGFDTADLHEAKALLDELSAEIGSPTA